MGIINANNEGGWVTFQNSACPVFHISTILFIGVRLWLYQNQIPRKKPLREIPKYGRYQMKNDAAIVPRTAIDYGCAASTLPGTVVSLIAVPKLGPDTDIGKSTITVRNIIVHK
jgi:hypothetical protein